MSNATTNAPTIADFATIAVGINYQLATGSAKIKGPYPFTQSFDKVVAAVSKWALGAKTEDGEVHVSLPIDFNEKVAEWVKVGHALSEMWQESWNDHYPFHMDFEEMLFEIERWVEG